VKGDTVGIDKETPNVPSQIDLERTCEEHHETAGTQYGSELVYYFNCNWKGYFPTQTDEKQFEFLLRQWDECPF
jgi:hypothetical protein